MLTKIFKTNPSNPDTKAIEEAAQIIKGGGLVAFPTETVYGLGADATDKDAAMKIYAAKGRPSDNPLIVHISDMDMLDIVASGDNKKAKLLAKKLWPGPITFILKKNDIIPKETTGGLNTVAVRMPGQKTALTFIRACGTPIAAPSANISGRPSPTKAAHVIEDFDGKIEGIIDDGQSDIGVESTIIDLTSDIPTILRKGYIDSDTVESVLGEKVLDESSGQNDKRPKAPGMKYKHYAPKGSLVFVTGKGSIPDFINKIVKDKGEPEAAVICCRENLAYYNLKNRYCLGSKDNEEELLKNLYDTLRQLDTDGIEICYCEDFSDCKRNDIISERLLRASGNNIIICDTTS